MCGIAGIIGEINQEDKHRVIQMNQAQSHRGPNADRVIEYPNAILGHRRLSVIDLSEKGTQPMHTPDGRYVTVYNGEIYNYKELKVKLSDSYKFITECDTEVLLAAWVKWGHNFIDRINGMFAFCIYDTHSKTAFFARDRFGQKPLYFRQEKGRLIFASEAKALLAAGVSAEPNMKVWSRYLVSASYDDENDSFFEGITQLKPGELAFWNVEQGLIPENYYSLAENPIRKLNNIDFKKASEQLKTLLIEVGRDHMQSDVPIGVSLSGGLDSSSMLATFDLGGFLGKDVHCFSFDFGEDFTERSWIEAAAKFHGLKTNIVEFTVDEFHSSIKPLIFHLEGPIGGLANCALIKVMEAARKNGIVVLQDGTGLDEAFAGYKNQHNLYIGLKLEKGGEEAIKAVQEYSYVWDITETETKKIGELELSRFRAQEHSSIDGSLPTFSNLLSKEFILNFPGSARPVSRGVDPLTDSLSDYLQVRKIPRNTRMKDRLSMAYSIELRLPFLDHRLVEYGLSLPNSFYFESGLSKSIVREALKGFMNNSVRIAPKRSIQAPQGKWLRKNPMKNYVGDLISSQSFKNRGIYNHSYVKSSFDNFISGKFDNSFFVWQWINVEEWFRTFIDRPKNTLVTGR